MYTISPSHVTQGMLIEPSIAACVPQFVSIYESCTEIDTAIISRSLYTCLQFYREGIYSDTICSTNPKNATHEMVVVGYGIDTTHGAYWILKNRYSIIIVYHAYPVLLT